MSKFNNKMVIELKDENGNIVDSRTYGNIVTDGYINLLKGIISPFLLQFGPNIRNTFNDYPPRKAFGGVQMFSDYLPETKDTISVDNVLVRGTAHAGGEYAGNDSSRGTLLTDECEYNENFIKLKWEWGTKKGNGVHKSIALTTLNGGNTGRINDILDKEGYTLRDDDLSTFNPFYSIVSGKTYQDSNPNIKNGGDIIGMSPDLKYIYVMRDFNGDANPIKCIIDELELVDFSNIRMNDYIYSCSNGVGLQRVRSIEVPDIPKDAGSGYNPTNYSFNPFRKEIYFFNTHVGIIRVYSIDSNSFIHTINIDKTDKNITVASNIGRIGDWIYIKSNNTDYTNRSIYRYLYNTGAYIDEYIIPYHSGVPYYYGTTLYQFSENELYLNCTNYAYIFDGEKFNGLYYNDGYDILHKTDYYPLLFRGNCDFAIDNRCLMTVHNFDAPITKQEGMTMTVTYLIQHAE